MEEFMFFFCKISVSLKLNLIEQVKQFYLLTITINLSTTSPETKQKKKRSKRQTRIKKNFDTRRIGTRKNAFFLCRIED